MLRPLPSPREQPSFSSSETLFLLALNGGFGFWDQPEQLLHFRLNPSSPALVVFMLATTDHDPSRCSFPAQMPTEFRCNLGPHNAVKRATYRLVFRL